MAVTLTFTDATGYDIFVNIGQSNNYSSYHLISEDVGHANIFQMLDNGALAGSISLVTGEPLSYPGAYIHTTDGAQIGNILAFCRDYYLVHRLQPGRKILIVPCAVGGVGFSNSGFGMHPAPYPGWGIVAGLGGGYYHERCITRVNAAMAAVAAPGGVNVIKACFCHSGEADAFWDAVVKPDGTAPAGGEYPLGNSYPAVIDYMKAEVADFRARWTGGGNVPFLFAHMSEKYLDTSMGGPGFKPGSMPAYEDIAKHIPNSLSISSGGLTTDNTKYDLSGDVFGSGPTGQKYIHFDAPSQRGGSERGEPIKWNPWSRRHWNGYRALVAGTPAGAVLANLAGYVDHDGGTTLTATGAPLGMPAANRYIVVAAWARVAAGIVPNIASVSVGGVNGTAIAGTETTLQTAGLEIWIVPMPTGTTGDIVVTWSGSTPVRSAIEVYRLTTNTPTPHNTNQTGSTNNSALLRSLTVPAQGVGLAVFAHNAPNQVYPAEITWTNATRDHTNYVGAVPANSILSTAYTHFDGTTSITAQILGVVSPSICNMAVVSWAP